MTQQISPADVLEALAGIPLPYTALPLADALSVDRGRVLLTLGYPVRHLAAGLRQRVAEALQARGITAEVELVQAIPAVQPANNPSQVAEVKNIIAVASGKGGVGKSTTAVNLALALAYEGASVGVLDADIYGPSQTQMLGAGGQRPEVVGENTIAPILAHGVQLASMGNLLSDNTPVIWRGPMVSGALKTLLGGTRWQALDYLIVDMPPGTGDIQLTLSQSVPVSSSIVVTTPQDIALLDAKKGIEMFRKVNIPVAGVVENMSTHICSNCGHAEPIFGEHGGERLAAEYGVELLGRLPLQMAIREQVDSGRPPLINDPESAVSLEYRSIAMKLAARLWEQAAAGPQGPEISFSDD